MEVIVEKVVEKIVEVVVEMPVEKIVEVTVEKGGYTELDMRRAFQKGTEVATEEKEKFIEKNL